MPVDIDPNLKKNFVKAFVCDIKENVKKYDMVWVQGAVKEVITDDLVELQDVADSFATISICGLKDLVKDTRDSSLKAGKYIQILGQVMVNGSKPQIKTIKFVLINDLVLQEFWPIEVEEAKQVLMES